MSASITISDRYYASGVPQHAAPTMHRFLRYGPLTTIHSQARGGPHHICDAATNPRVSELKIERLFEDGHRKIATILALGGAQVSVGDVLAAIEKLKLIDLSATTGDNPYIERQRGLEWEEEVCPCRQPLTILDYIRHQYGEAGLEEIGGRVWRFRTA